jgi:hypothetical protein
MKTDPKDPYVRIQLLQEKILRQRSALKSQRITILELQARLRKPDGVNLKAVNVQEAVSGDRPGKVGASEGARSVETHEDSRLAGRVDREGD